MKWRESDPLLGLDRQRLNVSSSITHQTSLRLYCHGIDGNIGQRWIRYGERGSLDPFHDGFVKQHRSTCHFEPGQAAKGTTLERRPPRVNDVPGCDVSSSTSPSTRGTPLPGLKHVQMEMPFMPALVRPRPWRSPGLASRKNLRPAVTVFTAGCIQSCHFLHGPSGCRDFHQNIAAGARVINVVVWAPGDAIGRSNIGDDLGNAARSRGNFLEFAVRAKPNPVSIRRKERQRKLRLFREAPLPP